MPVYRHGRPDAFFDGTSTYNATTNLKGGVGVPINALSAPTQVGQGGDNFSFYVTVSGSPAFATRWQLLVAHSGSLDSQGNLPDQDQMSYVWAEAWYLGTSGLGNSTPIFIDVPSGGGTVMTFVPDFSAGWARLKRTDTTATAVTVKAGFEVMAD